LIRDCDALLFPSWEPVSFPVGVACAFIACGALLACVVRRRLVLLLASGLVGYGSAVLFLFTGAPDLAFTQVSVETLFVVVISAVLLQLHHAHRSQPVAEKRWRPLAALVAGSFGLFVALLMALAMAQPQPASLTDYFFDNSLPGAKGRNVVNVIIVDFRGLDTLGEGTVILLSFLAAWPILTFLRSRRFPVDGGRNG
jgi:multicomponent Na+:H+ antiporter subunit A